MELAKSSMLDLAFERWCVAVTMLLEAGCENFRGRLAVGHVIYTRSRRRGLTIPEVCFQSYDKDYFEKDDIDDHPLVYQFSCFMNDSVNTFDSEHIFYRIEKEKNAYNLCTYIAIALSYGMKGFPNPAPGADHYYNPRLVKEPWWAKNMRVVAEVGRHVFLDSTKLREN